MARGCMFIYRREKHGGVAHRQQPEPIRGRSAIRLCRFRHFILVYHKGKREGQGAGSKGAGMKRFGGRTRFVVLAFAGVMLSVACVFATEQVAERWKVHDMKRPKPAVITPGQFATAEQASKPPSDAIVLLGNGQE